MLLRLFLLVLFVMPGISMAADRSTARVGAAGRGSQPASRSSSAPAAKTLPATDKAPAVAVTVDDAVVEVATPVESPTATPVETIKPTLEKASSGNCRDAYRACMDEFCLLDESEGDRCACSDNIERSKKIIQEIQQIQEEADKLYTEGVEREQLGAKAAYVFGESEAAKKSSRASGMSFQEWVRRRSGDDESVGEDDGIGAGLYAMAAEFCAAELEACGTKAEMEETLYSRMIVADCKTFESYLAEQKSNATANKRTAESAVRQARASMMDTTNKYNRGECLLAYRACVADKGGCGATFENCLDEALLSRRAHACEDVLDQCMGSRQYVLQDWEAEMQDILVKAAEHADQNRRQSCFARTRLCLEDGCSVSTNSACLTNVEVAAGICPVINECESMVPGFKSSMVDQLGFLRLQFCQNDIDKCLRDKCGVNFNAPECVGKKTSDIVALCPQSMFPSCKGETQFDIIVQAAVLQMDYQMLQGCVNYASELLGKTCGTDMECLPEDITIASLKSFPKTEEEDAQLRQKVIENANKAVDEVFASLNRDMTVAACQDSKKPEGRKSLWQSVIESAEFIGYNSAQRRALRALDSKLAELSRQEGVKEAEENCYNSYKVEKAKKAKNKSYSYISSVHFEPATRNCHVCRMQQVCETGGMSKAAAGLQAAAGGMAAGASAGTMISPGWGTAIGGVIGAVGAGIGGAMAGGEETYCQEIESCEDLSF